MLIGLTGCKGAGKNTAADFLVGYTQLAFADKLKQAVANLFGIDRELVDTLKIQDGVPDWTTRGHVILELRGAVQFDYDWREFLQRFGTEMGRNTFGENFWVDLLLPPPTMGEINDGVEFEDTVVTDVRFKNEAIRIKMLGGVVIEIVRPGHEPDGHASEEPLPRGLVDMTIQNDGTLEDLEIRFKAAIVALAMGLSHA